MIGAMLMLALPGPAWAQMEAVGEEIVVAALESPSRFWEKQVGVSRGGGFVAAANTNLSGDEGLTGHQWGRLYTSYGAPLDTGFLLNEVELGGNDGNLSLDMAPGGAFVAAWVNNDVWYDVRARRFSAFGDPLGPEIEVAEYCSSTARVAMADSGAFVVAHHDGGPDRDFVLAHIYDALGNPVASPIVVDTYHPTFNTFVSDVATNPVGTFVVVWSSIGSPGTDNDEESIQARCFTAFGTPLGDQFQVNTTIAGSQFGAKAGMADSGAFVIAWDSDSSPGNDAYQESIQMRRYSSACAPLGDQVQVNTYIPDSQKYPDVAVSPNGGSVVVWQSYGGSQEGHSIQARLYTADGQPRGDQFQVNVTTTGNQTGPAVSGDPDAKYVVVWEQDEEMLMARIFYGPMLLFADGFESGNTSSWSFVFW